jgi:NAD(P)-dependent dehydrogenase (short-subunit alcohol dehydrogenase family)
MARKLWAARLAAGHIHVFELRPGIMLTDMSAGVKEKYNGLIAEGIVPQQKWGTAEDVGLAAAALLNGSFPFSTGSVIDIDGGFHIRHL